MAFWGLQIQLRLAWNWTRTSTTWGRGPTTRAMAQLNLRLYLCSKFTIYVIYKNENKLFNIQSVKHVDFSIDVGEWNESKDWFCVCLCICVYYWNIEYSEGTNECSDYVLNNNITSAVHSRNLLPFTRNTIYSINRTLVISRCGLLVNTAPK